jgi:hypothetical protein
VQAGFLPQWPESIYRSQKSRSNRKRQLDPVIALEHIGNKRTLATYARGFVRLLAGNTCINTHEAPWRDEHATDNFRASTLISNHCIASAGAHYIDIWNYDINEHTEIRNPHRAPITALTEPCDDAMISAAYGDATLRFWEKESKNAIQPNPDPSRLQYPRPQRGQQPSCLNG